MHADRNLKQIRMDSVHDTATLIFDPEAFKNSESDLSIDRNKLD